MYVCCWEIDVSMCGDDGYCSELGFFSSGLVVRVGSGIKMMSCLRYGKDFCGVGEWDSSGSRFFDTACQYCIWYLDVLVLKTDGE